MAADSNTTLSHVYGIAGTVMGFIGLIVAVKAPAPWSEYGLLGSGWLAAGAYAVLLYLAFKRAARDSEEIGKLRQIIQARDKELSNRNATLDFLAGLQMGRTATPRIATGPDASHAAQEGEA